MTLELWKPMGSVRPEEIGAAARRAEDDGWDGLKIFDTQCLYGDAFVMSTAAALATTRRQLSLSTSNPATRHPAVAASAIASLAAIAGPRVYYGIGRGDSALAFVGGAPASVEMFERYVHAVRRYLHGDSVPFPDLDEWRLTRDVSTLDLGHAPETSSLRWLDRAAPPVPIEVYATGPRVLAVGGRRPTASPSASAPTSGGCGGPSKPLGPPAGRPVSTRPRCRSRPSFRPACPMTWRWARRSVANMVASSARFAVISGPVVGPVDPSQQKVYEATRAPLDPRR